MRSLGQLFLVFLLGKLCIVLGNGALRHRNDGKAAALPVSLLDLGDHLLYVIGNLRDQNDVCPAGHACVQGQPSHLMSHDLHNEHPAVGCCRGMDIVDGVRGDIHGALEAEGHVRSPEVIVDGLGQSNHIQSFLTQQIGRLVGAVAPEDHQTVQLQLVIILLHGLHLVEAVLVRIFDGLEGSTGGSQHSAALGQDAGEVLARQHLELAVDQPSISVQKTVDLQLLPAVVQRLHNPPHSRIQGLTVPAAGQHANSPHV